MSAAASNSSPFFFPPGGHFQTILRSYLNVTPIFQIQKTRLELLDGDFIDLEWSANSQEREANKKSPQGQSESNSITGKPTVLLLHGLEGSSQRPYMRSMANHLFIAGYQVVLLNFRGCSGEVNRRKITYHAGKYDDLEQVLQWVQSTLNPTSLHLVGFSLGASIILNFLIHSSYRGLVQSAATISPPLELSQISDQLQHGLRSVYQTYFLQSLREKTRLKRHQFADYPDFTGHTLRDFDDQVTALVHGFESAEKYYERCSTGSRLHQISCPVLIIHAENDPICPLPEVAIQKTTNPNIGWSIQKGGGHVAFITLPDGWLGNEVAVFLRK